METIPDWAKQPNPPTLFNAVLKFKDLFAPYDNSIDNTYPIVKALTVSPLKDDVSGVTMPSGDYLCFANDTNYIGCWSKKTRTLYGIERKYVSGTGENTVYSYHISSGDDFKVNTTEIVDSIEIDENGNLSNGNKVASIKCLNDVIGNINTALDNIIAQQESIIAIQNALIGGESV